MRDAGLPLPRLRAAYTEMLLVLRNLYQKCRLVHADLSEYNILYHKVGREGAQQGVRLGPGERQRGMWLRKRERVGQGQVWAGVGEEWVQRRWDGKAAAVRVPEEARAGGSSVQVHAARIWAA